MQKVVLGHAAYFVAGALIGGTATYFITKKVIEKKAFEQADEEIRQVKETYEMLRPSHIVEGSEEDRQRTHEYLEKLDNLGYGAQSEFPEGNNYTVSQELQDSIEEALTEENFDGQREESEDPREWTRTEDAPYVIHIDEYMQDKEEYDKFVLTYFEADNTLVSEDDSILADIEGIVGTANLLNFGAGNKDKNVVYIRNDKHEVDYEVVRNESSYSEVVLGIENWNGDDIPRTKRIRKMRDGS